MSKGSVGVALGAAGATAYLRPDLLLEWARNAAVRGSALSESSSKEIEQLAKLVEQLTHDVRYSSRSVTVVRGEAGSGFVTYTAAAIVVGGAAYLALRGWRLSDLCYVTQRTFRHGVANVAAGLDALGARVTDVKTRLQARIAEVSRKQDEAAAATAAMHANLNAVGADVEAIGGQVGQIHGSVMDLEAALAQVGADQRTALHGIYVLCKAVGELTAGSSIPSKDELLEFTQSPVWQRIRTQGLEGILRSEGNAPDARSPFLVGNNVLGARGGARVTSLLKPGANEAGSSRAAGAGLGFGVHGYHPHHHQQPGPNDQHQQHQQQLQQLQQQHQQPQPYQRQQQQQGQQGYPQASYPGSAAGMPWQAAPAPLEQPFRMHTASNFGGDNSWS